MSELQGSIGRTENSSEPQRRDTGERPPGPRGRWLLGSLPDLRRGRLEFLERCAREYGDVVAFRAVNRESRLVSHPDYIEELLVSKNQHFHKSKILSQNRLVFGNGLLTSEGDFWLRQRRLAQPAFHRQRIASYGTIMAKYSERMLDGWRDGQSFDLHAAMMQLTLEIVAKTLFDAEVTADAPEVGQAVHVLLENFLTRANRPVGIPEGWPTPENRRLQRAVSRLDRIIYGIIDKRRASGVDAGDLLSMLLKAQDEDGSRMTDKQLRDELMTLFLAGHETTAIALTWTFYLLAQHPAVDQELGAELSAVLGGRTPTIEDLPGLEFTGHVVTESMRLYPPAWIVARQAIEDTHIGGYAVPCGTMVFASQWVVHRDARWYANPLAFEPSRWATSLARSLPKFAYFPFGGGQRICIGNNFALMEANLLLASIAQHYRLELVPGQRVEGLPSITLRPRYGLKMTAHAR